jgi:hypothetical protein
LEGEIGVTDHSLGSGVEQEDWRHGTSRSRACSTASSIRPIQATRTRKQSPPGWWTCMKKSRCPI